MSFPDDKMAERNSLIVAIIGDPEMLASMYTELEWMASRCGDTPAARARCGGGGGKDWPEFTESWRLTSIRAGIWRAC